MILLVNRGKRGTAMDKVRVALILVTVAISLGPILGALVIYGGNLRGLVLPPNLSKILSGSAFTGGSIQPPTYAGSDYDNASRTMTLKFDFTNPFKFDMTLTSMTADVQCAFDGFALGKASLKTPVHLPTGGTAQLTIVGTWTEAAVNHFLTAHAGQTETDVNLVGLVIDMDGITVQMNQPIRVSHVQIP